MSANGRVKVATMWLSGCSGCHMSFLDLDERLVELNKLIEIVFSPVVDTKVKDMPLADVGIVEGCVNNEDQKHELELLRSKCKILLALGDCACSGNVPVLRNQFKLEECLTRAYIETESTEVGEIPDHELVPKLLNKARPLHEIVKVDGYIQGCPPDADTIWYALTELLAGRMPVWNEKNLKYD